MPKRQVMQTLSASDIEGRHYVIVKIRPQLPQERMVVAQLAQAYRAPGADGRPLMDDRTILETIIEHEYPDTVGRRIDQQLLPAESQEIKKLQIAAREQIWMEENPSTLQKAEKRLGEAMNLRPEELKTLLGLLMKLQGGAVGLEQMLAMADQAAAQPLAAAQGGPLGGPNPAALPSQFQMTEEPMPDQSLMVASQARRGRPVNPA